MGRLLILGKWPSYMYDVQINAMILVERISAVIGSDGVLGKDGA